MVIHETCPTTKPKSTGIITYPLIRGKFRGVPVFSATLSGDSMSNCTSILSGEINSTVPTRNEANRSIGVVIIRYSLVCDVVFVVVGVESAILGTCLLSDGVVGVLDVAPNRCCKSSAILIVVLSIADLGK